MWLIGYHLIRFDGILCEHTYAIPKSTRGIPFIYIEGHNCGSILASALIKDRGCDHNCRRTRPQI